MLKQGKKEKENLKKENLRGAKSYVSMDDGFPDVIDSGSNDASFVEEERTLHMSVFVLLY